MADSWGRNLWRGTAVLAIVVMALVIGIVALRPTGLVPSNGPGSPPGVPGGPGTGGQGNQGGVGEGSQVIPGPAGSMENVWHGLWISFGLEERTYVVIQTEAEWRALWAEEGATFKPPSVDLRSRTVLVAFHGLAPTTGHDIRIKGVTLEASGTYTVSVEVTHPGARCATGQALSHPVDMVSIPKANGPFDFKATVVVVACP